MLHVPSKLYEDYIAKFSFFHLFQYEIHLETNEKVLILSTWNYNKI